MIRPEPEVVKAFANASQRFPEVLEFLSAWKAHELEALPSAINNPAVSQGRCQVLCELVKFVSESPELATTPTRT